MIFTQQATSCNLFHLLYLNVRSAVALGPPYTQCIHQYLTTPQYMPILSFIQNLGWLTKQSLIHQRLGSQLKSTAFMIRAVHLTNQLYVSYAAFKLVWLLSPIKRKTVLAHLYQCRSSLNNVTSTMNQQLRPVSLHPVCQKYGVTSEHQSPAATSESQIEVLIVLQK